MLDVLHVRRLLYIGDIVLCLFIFFPALLMYWRGIWDLYSAYILPDQEPQSHWLTTGIGACCIIGYVVQPLIHKSRPWSVWYELSCRMYMYVYGALSMAYWRGVWKLGDYYLADYSWKGSAVGLALCYGLLVVLKASRSAMWPPFVVALDTREDRLVPTTRFDTTPSRSSPLSLVKYVADSLLTQYVIVTLAILSWRHLMSILDVIIYPSNAFYSDLISLVVGAVCCLLLLASEELLVVAMSRLKSPWSRLLLHDVVYFLAFVSHIHLWRGVWNMNVRYMLSDPVIGGWVNHVVGALLLMMLQLFSVVGCGCLLDDPDNLFLTSYLRYYITPSQTQESVHRGLAVNIVDNAPISNNQRVSSSYQASVGLT